MERLKAKEELKESMQKEVNLMREVLANLLQEESFLFQHDQNSKNSLTQDRFFILEKIKELRFDRENIIQKLSKLSPKNEKSLPFFDFLLLNDDDTCEIALILDLLVALTDKINEQNTRNQRLSLEMQHLVAFTNTLPYSTRLENQSTLRKNTLLTISKDEHEDRY